ncbi:MAG: HAD family phosphatase [Flavobacteriales bacterium]|nr:HAD family phosphatase [Flavobacteriales bacterium]
MYQLSLEEAAEVKDVIFDFGGVLFEIDYNAPVREFEKLGFSNFREEYSQAFQNKIFDLLETGKIGNDEFFSYISSFCLNANLQQIHDAWNAILTGIWPQNVALVQLLKDRGFRTFLLSNTNAFHVSVFEEMIDHSLGMDKMHNAFEHIYYSNVIGMKKPYPETFLAVCEWNSLIPAQTLFIDDSIQHVEGALKAGLKAHHLRNMNDLNSLVDQLLIKKGIPT